MNRDTSRRFFLQCLGLSALNARAFKPKQYLVNAQVPGKRKAARPGQINPFAGPPISRLNFQKRLERIRHAMLQQDLSCLILSSVMNHAVRYLGFFDPDLQGRPSGSPQLALVLLSLDGPPTLFLQTFTSAPHLLQRTKANSLIEDVRLIGGKNEQVLEKVVEQLRNLKIGTSKIGVAGGEIDWAVTLYLSDAFPQAHIENATPMLDALRIIKDEEEIALLRRSAAIGDAGLRAVQRYLRPGLSDFDIYAIAENEMRRQGADEDSFILMGMGPSQNAMLMDNLNFKRVRPDSVVVLETLPFYRNYNTEMAITFSVGRTSKKQQKAARACEEAYFAGVEQARPGAATAHMVEESLKVFRSYGFDSYTHGSGHFIGLDNYEGPPLKDSALFLRPNMVFSFHPNVVIPNEVKEQICGLLLVTEKGVENLSKIRPTGMHAAG